MVKLRKRGPVRVDLGGGVVVTASAIGAADIDLAVQAVRRRLGMAADAAAGLARYGIAAPDVEEGGEALGLALYGVPESLLAIELGIRHVKAWEGVLTDAEGDAPAPVEPGYVALLFNAWVPSGPVAEGLNYGRAWLRKMLAHSTLESDAPKGSAASPGTSTAEAATIAGDAVKPETPAPLAGK
jgi:hypothetical protein